MFTLADNRPVAEEPSPDTRARDVADASAGIPRTSTALIIPAVVDRETPGWPHDKVDEQPSPAMGHDPLASLLSDDFNSDAHFLSYHCPSLPPRLNTCVFEMIPDLVVWMVLQVFDVDSPASHRSQGGDGKAAASDAWWDVERSKVSSFLVRHPGAFVYRTQGGYRIVLIRQRPFPITGEDSIRAWVYDYCRACCYLARVFGIVADPACATWNRLFRLPHATRNPDASSEHLEVIGDPLNVGPWEYEPTEPTLEADLDVASLHAARDKGWHGKLNSTLRPKGPRSLRSKKEKAAPPTGAAPVNGPPPDEVVASLLPVLASIGDGRHELYLALAGTLCQRGVDGARVLAVVRDLAMRLGDSRSVKRLHDAQTTIDRIGRGETVKAYGHLALSWPQVAAAIDGLLGAEETSGFQAVASEFASRPALSEVDMATGLASIRQAYVQAKNSPGALVVAAVTPGAGKTMALVDAAIAAPHRTAIVFPTNRLSEGNFRRIQQARQDVQRRFGVLSLLNLDGTPACTHYEVARRLQEAGMSVPRALCGRCGHKTSCTSLRGIDGACSAQIVVTNHCLVGLALDTVGEGAMLVIDESPALFDHESFSLWDFNVCAQLLQERAFLRPFNDASLPFVLLVRGALALHAEGEQIEQALARAAERCATDLEFMRSLAAAQQALQSDAKCVQDLPDEARDLFRNGVGEDLDPPISNNTARRIRESTGTASTVAQGCRVLRALARWAASGEPAVVRFVDAKTRMMARNRIAQDGGFVSSTFLPVVTFSFANTQLLRALRRPGPTLLLDATPDVGALRVLAGGRAVNEISVDVADGAPVERLVTYWTKGNRRALLRRGKACWEALGPGLSLIFEALIGRGLGTALLVTYKAVEEQLREYVVTGRPLPHAAAQAAWAAFRKAGGTLLLAHYGNVRGRNEFDGRSWQDFDAVVTLGDPLPNLGEAKAEAQLLGLDSVSADQRLLQMAAAELGQAHGRLRTPQRTRPGFCLHLGRIVPWSWTCCNARLESAPACRRAAIPDMAVLELEQLISKFGSARRLALAAGVNPSTITRHRQGTPVCAELADRLRAAPLGNAKVGGGAAKRACKKRQRIRSAAAKSVARTVIENSKISSTLLTVHATLSDPTSSTPAELCGCPGARTEAVGPQDSPLVVDGAPNSASRVA